MAKKAWRAWDGDECMHCGCSAEVLTNAPLGYACDSDDARCTECGCSGIVCIDAEPDEVHAYISWHDDATCDCDWCKAHYDAEGNWIGGDDA